MNRPRVIDARASLLPQSLGLCATDITTLCAYINEATERLINDPISPEDGWWGQWARMAFNVTRSDPNIYLPQGIARIILLDVCSYPVRIQNQFFEFLQFGRGLQPKGCANANGGNTSYCQTLQAYEREVVTTFAPLLSTPQYIRAYNSDPADVGRTALIQGADSNGQTVRYLDALTSSSGLGERVTFGSPFSDSANLFSTITGIQKDKTFGEVQIFQVDATTGAESPLLVMGPGETTASYRKYFVNGLPTRCCNNADGSPIQIQAMVKLDFTPVTTDSDYLGLLSIPAIMDECQAIRYSRMDVPGAQQLSANKHQSALRILFGQLQHYEGNEMPAIQRHIFGSGSMRLQPL